ncbi:MAG TPA: hypothetical protein VNJ54_20110 [Plantibacter sp.]|nr:hypothetical protein [Plantibacter sp.]
MSIIALLIGILIVAITVIAFVATVRAVLTDGYRRAPNCPHARGARLQ